MKCAFNMTLSIMTQVGNVHMFRDYYVAIHRPIKRTYSVLQWMPEGAYWKRALLDPALTEGITVRRNTITPAPCSINYIRNNVIPMHIVKCLATGIYLRYGTHDISIIQKLPHSIASFPNNTYAGEFTCTVESEEPPETRPLWTVVLTPPTAAPIPIIMQQVKTPLPRRIAWILAEDASKKGETCSITLEQISPITASVTTCYHVFDSSALAIWLTTSNKCPMCKHKTVATKAYDDVSDVSDATLDATPPPLLDAVVAAE